MKVSVNVGELKNHLSEYLERVGKGEEVVVCKRNIPFATLTGLSRRRNRSQPGWAGSSLTVLGPVEGPAVPEGDWLMYSGNPESVA